MKACTFFGHKDCPSTIIPLLEAVIMELINDHNVEMFYVGNQGQFDAYVRRVLRKITARYSHISYAVVLAYMPHGELDDFTDTMLPEGIEKVHPRYAISWRNRWMIRRADYVVAYITHSWGGAAQWVNAAKSQHRQVISLVSPEKNCGDSSAALGM